MTARPPLIPQPTRIAEPRQRGAIGTHQEDRLDQITARLLDGECGEFAIIQRAFAHHAIDGERELLGNLVEAKLRHRWIAPAHRGQQRMGILDGALSALDGHIHQACSVAIRTERGSAASLVSAANMISTPRGNSPRLAPMRAAKSAGSGAANSARLPLM